MKNICFILLATMLFACGNNNSKSEAQQAPAEVAKTEAQPVVYENNSEIDMINIIPKSEDNNNMFWIPISDEKIESSSFPSLNLPINDKIDKNSEFVFPNINN